MAQGKFSNGVDVLHGDCRRATPGRMGAGRTQPDQIGAQTVDTGSETALGDVRQRSVVQRNLAQAASSVFAAFTQLLLFGFPLRAEPVGIAVEIQAAPEDLPALGRQGLPA